MKRKSTLLTPRVYPQPTGVNLATFDPIVSSSVVSHSVSQDAVVRVVSSLCIFLLLLPLFGCSATGVDKHGQIDDPLEGFNRAVFEFNDTLDVYVLEPVARGYDWALPPVVQDGIGNIFENLGYPRYLASSLLQGKFQQALDHTGRFVVNSTVGLAGVVDVAQHMGMPKHQEDIGLALAFYDVPHGPYLVLPLLGPTTIRDGVGTIVDTLLDPLYWIAGTDKIRSSDRFWITTGAGALRVVDTRAGLLDAVEAAKESSLDYYLFLQGAYYQYREGLLQDKAQESYFEQGTASSSSADSQDQWWDDDEDLMAPPEGEIDDTAEKAGEPHKPSVSKKGSTGSSAGIELY